MNYRHHFHAGNFADVMKHVLLIGLLRTMQRKEKGFLYLDTHAGRGRYDLLAAATGDSHAREAEWPHGIGRLLALENLPARLAEYVGLVREFDRRFGNLQAGLRFYPGSPWIARELGRLQDRLALYEQHPAEAAALKAEFQLSPCTVVHANNGYGALRALLPPVERRALVLIDPPFEAQDEFALIARALGEGLIRFRSGVFCIWYPLTERARVDEFFAAVRQLQPPPTLAIELEIAGPQSIIKLKGCGLLVINPPWQFDAEARELMGFLAAALAQAPQGRSRVEWVVPE